MPYWLSRQPAQVDPHAGAPMSKSPSHLRSVPLDVTVSHDLPGDAEMLRAEVYHLRRAMEGRAPIEQAKGILMLRYGLDAERAFDLLVRWSNHTNLKLNVLAEALTKIVGGGEEVRDPPAETVRLVVERFRRSDP